MEFDINRVYTVVNADELKVGSKVICADNISQLRESVHTGKDIETLENVASDSCLYRFECSDDNEYALAYLVEPPEEKKLKVSDLKIGDVVRHKTGKLEFLITGIDNDCNEVFFGADWSDDENLGKFWEKVEK